MTHTIIFYDENGIEYDNKITIYENYQKDNYIIFFNRKFIVEKIEIDENNNKKIIKAYMLSDEPDKFWGVL